MSRRARLGAYRDAEALAARAAADPVRARITELEAKPDPTGADLIEIAMWRSEQLAAKAVRDEESAARLVRLQAEAAEREARWDAERGAKIEAARARRGVR